MELSKYLSESNDVFIGLTRVEVIIVGQNCLNLNKSAVLLVDIHRNGQLQWCFNEDLFTFHGLYFSMWLKLTCKMH